MACFGSRGPDVMCMSRGEAALAAKCIGRERLWRVRGAVRCFRLVGEVWVAGTWIEIPVEGRGVSKEEGRACPELIRVWKLLLMITLNSLALPRMESCVHLLFKLS